MHKNTTENTVSGDQKYYSLDLIVGSNTYSEPLVFCFIKDPAKNIDIVEVYVPESIPVGILFKKENDATPIPKVEIRRVLNQADNTKFYNSFTFNLSEKNSQEKNPIVGSTEQAFATQPEAFIAFYNQLFSLNFQNQGQKKAILKYLKDYGARYNLGDYLPQYYVPAFLAKKPNIGFAIFLGLLIVASVIMLGVIAPPLVAGAIMTIAAIIELTVGSAVIAFALPAFISALRNIHMDRDVPPLSGSTIIKTSTIEPTATPAHVNPTSDSRYTGMGSNTPKTPNVKAATTEKGKASAKPDLKEKDKPEDEVKKTDSILTKSVKKEKEVEAKVATPTTDLIVHENPDNKDTLILVETVVSEAPHTLENKDIPPAGQEEEISNDPSLGYAGELFEKPDSDKPEDEAELKDEDVKVLEQDDEIYNSEDEEVLEKGNKRKSSFYATLKGKDLFN